MCWGRVGTLETCQTDKALLHPQSGSELTNLVALIKVTFDKGFLLLFFIIPLDYKKRIA